MKICYRLTSTSVKHLMEYIYERIYISYAVENIFRVHVIQEEVTKDRPGSKSPPRVSR